MKYISLFIFIFAQEAFTNQFKQVEACVQSGYQGLTNRDAIVAAVVDSSEAKVFTFGNAKEDQLFEIGSVTKTFTGTLLAQAVAEGKVKLSDPITQEYQKPGYVITFQHLATHTSGIVPDIFAGYQINDEKRPFEGFSTIIFKELYSQANLVSQPGTKWAYSNNGTSLLGLILSELYQRSYEELVQEKIFKVLGMKESYFAVPENLKETFPLGYLTNPETGMQQTPHWNLSDTAINPAGGIRSTIGDMIKYARVNLLPESSTLQKSILLAQQSHYQIVDGVSMGVNWILNSKDDLIWHNGQTYGFNSILAISKIKGIAVVAMTNTSINTGKPGPQEWDTALQDIVFNCLK